MTHEAKGLKTRRLAACESPSISAAKFTEALLRFLSPESVSFWSSSETNGTELTKLVADSSGEGVFHAPNSDFLSSSCRNMRIYAPAGHFDPPPVMVGLSPIYCWIIPTLTGLFRSFFTLTCVYEENTRKYLISWLHKRRVSAHCIYDEISGYRWGCGEWGGRFSCPEFGFFFVFLP